MEGRTAALAAVGLALAAALPALWAARAAAAAEARAQAAEAAQAQAEAARAQAEAEAARQAGLRQTERQGRVTAERRLRESAQSATESEYPMSIVADCRSVFPDRRGTPRQPALAPDALGRIQFRRGVSPEALSGLEGFSHLWVLFVFHENTDAAKAGSKATFRAKVAPPRLGGKRTGLYSTRTPHRPNPVGLSVVRIERVHGRTIEVSGLDLVDGTPVLDVKPVVPYDAVPAPALRVPHWVTPEGEPLPTAVRFQPAARDALRRLVADGRLHFYGGDADRAERAIQQVLGQDIRSVHQGRGKPRADPFEFAFDRLQLTFTVSSGGSAGESGSSDVVVQTVRVRRSGGGGGAQ